MPSLIGLIVTIAVVLILLRIDYLRAPENSPALWIPTVWLLISASRPVAAWFAISATAEEADSSPMDQFVLIMLLALGLFILSLRHINWRQFFKENTWLITLLWYFLLSTFWSEIQSVSIKRWIREFIAIIMALVVLSEQNPLRAAESIFRRTAYILLPFSLLLIKYFPIYGVQWGRWSGEIMWIGVTMQKNGLGRLCMISSFFLIWSLLQRSQKKALSNRQYIAYADLLILALSFILMFGPTVQAYSATAVTALLAGLAAYALRMYMKKYRIQPANLTFNIVLVLIIILGTTNIFIGGSTVAGFSGVLGRDTTLTGRTDVWASLLPAVLGRFSFGHGFGGFWTNTTRKNYDISEAHSGYLDVLLETGLCGLLLFTLFLVASSRKALKTSNLDYNWATLWICYIFMAAIHNITETSFTSLTSHLSAVILFLTVSSSHSTSFFNISKTKHISVSRNEYT